MVQIPLQRSPSAYLAKGQGFGGEKGRWELGYLPPEHRDPGAAISGIPFMVDQDGKQRGENRKGGNPK